MKLNKGSSILNWGGCTMYPDVPQVPLKYKLMYIDQVLIFFRQIIKYEIHGSMIRSKRLAQVLYNGLEAHACVSGAKTQILALFFKKHRRFFSSKHTIKTDQSLNFTNNSNSNNHKQHTA